MYYKWDCGNRDSQLFQVYQLISEQVCRRIPKVCRTEDNIVLVQTLKHFEDRPQLNLGPDIFMEQEEAPSLPFEVSHQDVLQDVHVTLETMTLPFEQQKKNCSQRLKGVASNMATTSEEDSLIVAASKRDPTLTAKEIRDELNLAASPYVVRRRLHEGGLHSRVPVRKPLLSAINKSKRLAFAEEHVSWTVDDWRMVLFSDESTITTRWDQRQRIWRTDCTS
ncbi:hypothetical protein HPB47_019474 [Ixodes persulcatus]|uniref:Uncharacterized protein n=1 Tax=Ixodes persulcatus TaxID=34615 RepID=A0AC60QI30_IXOPE|nr:hypothetical protein HPB47_019474 [Ixodes persulcatus]